MKRDAPWRSHPRYKLHNGKRHACEPECIPIRVCSGAQESQDKNAGTEDKDIRSEGTAYNRSNCCAKHRSHEPLAGDGKSGTE
jgi:hypothetical protein